MQTLSSCNFTFPHTKTKKKKHLEMSLFIGYCAIVLLVHPTLDHTGLNVEPELKRVRHH